MSIQIGKIKYRISYYKTIISPDHAATQKNKNLTLKHIQHKPKYCQHCTGMVNYVISFDTSNNSENLQSVYNTINMQVVNLLTVAHKYANKYDIQTEYCYNLIL